jgi:hypothetical protein
LQPVRDDGFQAGGQPVGSNGSGNGLGYDFSIGRISDTLVDLAPGERQLADAEAHAEAFLVWLQGDAEVGGNWIRRSLLEKLYAGPFVEIMAGLSGWSPEPWPTVARYFRKRPGVKVRQKDLRGGAYRSGGPSTATDYWIPRRSNKRA